MRLCAAALACLVILAAGASAADTPNEDMRALDAIAVQFRSATADAWTATAELLGRYAKWKEAAEAEERAVDALRSQSDADSRRKLAVANLLLARYLLNAGDADRAEKTLAGGPPSAQNSLSAAVLRAEIALTRGNLEVAAETVAALQSRAPEPIDDEALTRLSCSETPLTPGAIHAFLQTQLEMASGNTERAIVQLEQVLREQPMFADATVRLANALHDADRSAEALQRLRGLGDAPARALRNCSAVLLDRVFLNAGNIAWDRGERNEAADFYRKAIDDAAERETRFQAVVASGADLPSAARTILQAARRAPHLATPAAQNNLGHLLLETAGDDPVQLVAAKRAFLTAAANPEYETPQYAHLGHAYTALRAEQWEEAVQALASALWVDPAYRNALDAAASLAAREAPRDVAVSAGTLLLAAAGESLPQRFTDLHYGPTLTQLAQRVAGMSSEPVQQYLVSFDLHRGDLDSAATRLENARSTSTASLWPLALSGQVAAERGNEAEAMGFFRSLQQALGRTSAMTTLDAFAVRQSLPAYAAVAERQGTSADVQHAENLLTTSFGASSIEIARAFPWERAVSVRLILTDATGAPLPGVTVTIQSPLTPPQTAITGLDGSFRVQVRPGSYEVKAELEGFTTRRQKIVVDPEGGQLSLALNAEIAEAITVSAAAPLEPGSTGQQVTAEQFESLPVVRSLTGTASLFPGATSSSQGVINGASAPENHYVIDGVQAGDWFITAGGLQDLNLDVISEFQIVTSGHTAAMPDAVLQFRTREATNDLTISAEGFSQPRGGRAKPLPVVVPYEREQERRQWRGAVSIGGPLIFDRLWLLGRAAREEEHGNGGVDAHPSTRRRVEGFLKATANVGEHSHIASAATLDYVSDDRSGGLNDVAGALFGSRSATSRRATRRSVNGTLSGSILHGANASSQFRLASYRDESTLRPSSNAGEEVQFHNSLRQLFASGGVGFINDGRVFHRDTAAVVLSVNSRGYRWYHDLAAGAEYVRERDSVHDRISGGFVEEGAPAVESFVRYWSDDRAPATAPVLPEIRETFESTPLSVFFHDRITSDRLIVEAGAKWMRQSIDFPRSFALTTDVLQPRLSVTFRRSSDTNLFVTGGRFAEVIGADERIGLGSARRYVVAEEIGFADAAYGGLAAIDPDLRGRYYDEVSAGFTHRARRNTVRVAVVRQRLQSDIHDFLCQDGRRCIGNPGRGNMSTTPRARREIDTVEVSADGQDHSFGSSWGWNSPRGSVNWSLAYVWGRRRGNVESPNLAATRINGIDPYSRPEFDLPTLVPPFGPLARNRRHTARAWAVAKIDGIGANRFVFSTLAFWHSGEPRGRFGYSDLYGRHVLFLDRLGVHGRSPSAYDLDARLALERKIGIAEVQFAAVVENVLDRQTPLIEDQRADFSARFPNETFLQPMERTAPRTIQLLARVQF